ncbi:MAG: hypothetical protein Q4G71_04005 [Pseudomonadota bacterium]|nr:hypothetical protein [Pseudomonadota bacterium]
MQLAQPLPPRERALAGYQIAAGTSQASAGPVAQALADAPANARTALARTDLPSDQAAKLRVVVERLGNEVIDGRIAPQMNNEFRQKLYDLATAEPNSSRFNGAMAHMTRAAEVLDRVTLAQGTSMAFDPKSGANLADARLPLLDVPDLDADLYFKTRDGVLHVESVKAGVTTLASELRGSAEGERAQLGRQAAWQRAGTPDEPRRVSVYAGDDSAGFGHLMDGRNLGELRKTMADADGRSIVLGERAYSINDLDALNAAAKADMQRHVDGAKQAHLAAGRSPESFKAPYGAYVNEHMQTPLSTMERVNMQVGQAEPPLGALPRASMPTASQGGLWGGAVAGGVSAAVALGDGRLTADEGRQVLAQAGIGAGAGALTAAGERIVAPAIDRALGPAIERRVTAMAASRVTPALAGTVQGTASAASTGFAVRTVASRAMGATGVGAVVATGVSAYENRAGLARGDAQAIGNVTADAAVAVTSIASAAAVGAAVGSVVPVAGTAVGAVVGLAVGVGVAYGAEISGARDWVADKVGGAISRIKSWF